jgi:hypothetical protein
MKEEDGIAFFCCRGLVFRFWQTYTTGTKTLIAHTTGKHCHAVSAKSIGHALIFL